MDTTELAEAESHAHAIAAELELFGERASVGYDPRLGMVAVHVQRDREDFVMGIPRVGERYPILWASPLLVTRGEDTAAKVARAMVTRMAVSAADATPRRSWLWRLVRGD